MVTRPQNTPIQIWLLSCCIMVVAMIIIGGITRLTGSGLSMTDWQPITGFLPPFTAAQWQSEFARYKLSPEFIKVNHFMTLKDFTQIFYIEYIHRLFARLTGLVYLLPLIFFWARSYLSFRQKLYFCLIGLLIISQAIIGWYMVKSGLINEPKVSHIRLAVHHMLAIIIFSLLWWEYLRHKNPMVLTLPKLNIKILQHLIVVILPIMYVQITLGALVAGLDAGYIYNQFPLMGNSFIPEEISQGAISLESLNNPVFVQLIHRIGAYILSFCIVMLWIIALLTGNNKLIKATSMTLLCLVIQVSLGVITLIYGVPLIFGLLHQIGAVILLSALLLNFYLLKNI